MLLSKAALPTVATASVTLDPIRASSLCWKDHKNSRVQKGDSRLPSKAFSDAAFIYAYLQMLLPKAALHTYVGEITKTAAFKKAKASYLYCLF